MPQPTEVTSGRQAGREPRVQRRNTTKRPRASADKRPNAPHEATRSSGLMGRVRARLGRPTGTVPPIDPSALAQTKPQPTGPLAITIVVPIHDARESVMRCLESLVRNTVYPAELLLIDDASTDPEMVPMLRRFAGRHAGVRLLVNETNRGFVGTVNRGIRETRSHVLILNSDTEVTPGWLRRIAAAASSDSRIASVTPLSDNAGAFSVPRLGEAADLPKGLTKDQLGRAFSHASARELPSTPTGHGFCMFMRREAIDQVGIFDEAAFPRGYGEENDWCMRASAFGWRHVIDDSTLVFHQRSASFGDERHALMDAARRTIDQRYPNYGRAVHAFVTSEAMERIRARSEPIFRTGYRQHSTAPRVLLLTRASSIDSASEVETSIALSEHYERLHLVSNADGSVSVVEPTVVVLQDRAKTSPVACGDTSRQTYRDLLISSDIEIVHVGRSFPEAAEWIVAARDLAIPMVVAPEVDAVVEDRLSVSVEEQPAFSPRERVGASRDWYSGVLASARVFTDLSPAGTEQTSEPGHE